MEEFQEDFYQSYSISGGVSPWDPSRIPQGMNTRIPAEDSSVITTKIFSKGSSINFFWNISKHASWVSSIYLSCPQSFQRIPLELVSEIASRISCCDYFNYFYRGASSKSCCSFSIGMEASRNSLRVEFKNVYDFLLGLMFCFMASLISPQGLVAG